MFNQLSKFVPNLAKETKPLQDVHVFCKDNAWIWEQPHQESFDTSKELLFGTPVLALSNPNTRTVVSGNASSQGLGGVLLQEHRDETVKPVSYISRSLSSMKRYMQIEKEALIFIWACERFSDLLVGVRFRIKKRP